MIARNGEHDTEDGPRFDVMKIIEYSTPEFKTVWGVVYRCEVSLGMSSRYEEPSDYIINPRVIFRRIEP
jgi:hypothetical protein